MNSIRNYLQSRSTLYGYLIGTLLYFSYAPLHAQWRNPALVAVAVFVGWFIPFYSRLSNHLEERVQFRTALVTGGRLARLFAQFAFNCGIFFCFRKFGVIPVEKLNYVGGMVQVALITTFASQGLQYLAISAANREIGEKNRNVLVALSLNVITTALATWGISETKFVFYVFGFGLGGLFFAIGLLSDLRAYFAPTGGIGIFFGTFNPIHNTHLEIIRRAIQDRNLSVVYIHSTVIPRLHTEALRKGEIRIARHENGMRVYEKTETADIHQNYFPTGNRFYEFETRKKMMEIGIEEAGLRDTRVLSFPSLYARDGFYGIIRRIRELHPRMRIHAIHGSDLGGMWIRGIYDESGWLYPYPVKRMDRISATAIRNDAIGMAPDGVEQILKNLREGQNEFQLRGLSVRNTQGVITDVSQ